MREHVATRWFRALWERLRIGPARPPRVTDDGEDDGLTGSRVPRKPIVPNLSGSAAAAIPDEHCVGATAVADRP